MRILVNTTGLVLALQLYGVECVRTTGDWTTPAIVEIPDTDAEAFKELLREEGGS